jgi:hypothetical protein
MTMTDLQQRCEQGQEQLMRMEYLQAEATLCEAEKLAWTQQDWDTLARLYMPLQEARRQRRQRCGEGAVVLDLIALGPQDAIDGRRIVENYPHGQLLVAGWGSIEPALKVRELQAEHGLYVETFLAAAYPVGDQRAVVIVPLPDVQLPPPEDMAIDDLTRLLPAHCMVHREDELPSGVRKGTWETYAQVMEMWERLHRPFLASADMQVDPIQKIDGYRKTIRVDYAAELAHQKLSDTAHALLRKKRDEAGACPPTR